MRDFELAARLIGNLDLTSLNADDNEEKIADLCAKAVTPFGKTAAVCVYPRFVRLARKLLHKTDIAIATVVNFPQGSSDCIALSEEIAQAVMSGADEIDAVFPYRDFLAGKLNICQQFMDTVVEKYAPKKIKIILESGEFSHINQLQEACRLCLQYDIAFLKTSTGKTAVSATVDVANAILESISASQRPVGFKASGGIKTFEQARRYWVLSQAVMGDEWPTSDNFRIGASSLLNDLILVAQKGE